MKGRRFQKQQNSDRLTPGSTEENNGRKRLSASFVTGAIALVFLIIGYQSAIFIHKAAILKIAADHSHPDTVYLCPDHPSDTSGSFSSGTSDGFSSAASRISESSGTPGRSEFPVSRDDVQGRDITHGQNRSGRKREERYREIAGAASDYYSDNSGASPEPETFRFNPNTVSTADLQRLGFSEKQAFSIENYRKKGGVFRRKSDFSKSFVVSPETYRRLESFIDIPLVDINKADSAAFDALPGIGPHFASAMVAYRDRLGSYSRLDQLLEIWNFGEERFDGIHDLICLDPVYVRPFPLWTSPADSLKQHPHIRNWRTAEAIVFFRDHSPRQDWSLDALLQAGILTPEQHEGLMKCLIAAP